MRTPWTKDESKALARCWSREQKLDEARAPATPPSTEAVERSLSGRTVEELSAGKASPAPERLLSGDEAIAPSWSPTQQVEAELDAAQVEAELAAQLEAELERQGLNGVPATANQRSGEHAAETAAAVEAI